MDYWKRAALGSKNEDERKRLTDQARLRIFLARKDAIKSGAENVYEILFYLKTIIYLILKSELLLETFCKMIDFHSKKCLIT